MLHKSKETRNAKHIEVLDTCVCGVLVSGCPSGRPSVLCACGKSAQLSALGECLLLRQSDAENAALMRLRLSRLAAAAAGVSGARLV